MHKVKGVQFSFGPVGWQDKETGEVTLRCAVSNIVCKALINGHCTWNKKVPPIPGPKYFTPDECEYKAARLAEVEEMIASNKEHGHA